MTPEQKERIKLAARELSAAMTDVGDEFHVRAGSAEVTAVGDDRRKFVYSLTIEAISRGVIS